MSMESCFRAKRAGDGARANRSSAQLNRAQRCALARKNASGSGKPKRTDQLPRVIVRFSICLCHDSGQPTTVQSRGPLGRPLERRAPLESLRPLGLAMRAMGGHPTSAQLLRLVRAWFISFPKGGARTVNGSAVRSSGQLRVGSAEVTTLTSGVSQKLADLLQRTRRCP